ncbi:hypothetical protein NDU88_002573 [Pleurodeles waltl]|uniref:Uncharacterized protein n=1 Tax=Pleurodeles waltl TaxID=8319 RepID=A0AAV7W3G6_PLEWA|nr:hypothetical protein NDU88_002573 [Pleurodeles waltl]
MAVQGGAKLAWFPPPGLVGRVVYPEGTRGLLLAQELVDLDCSRLSSNAALASEWRCSRGRKISVPGCPDDQEAGACAMTPDFQVPGTLNSEDGLKSASEDQEAEESAEAESSEREKNERRSGNTSISRDAAHPEDQEWSEDTLRSRHVPGEAWLTKTVPACACITMQAPEARALVR